MIWVSFFCYNPLPFISPRPLLLKSSGALGAGVTVGACDASAITNPSIIVTWSSQGPRHSVMYCVSSGSHWMPCVSDGPKTVKGKTGFGGGPRRRRDRQGLARFYCLMLLGRSLSDAARSFNLFLVFCIFGV